MFRLETKMNPTGFPPVAETLLQAIDRIVHRRYPVINLLHQKRVMHSKLPPVFAVLPVTT